MKSLYLLALTMPLTEAEAVAQMGDFGYHVEEPIADYGEGVIENLHPLTGPMLTRGEGLGTEWCRPLLLDEEIDPNHWAATPEQADDIALVRLGQLGIDELIRELAG